MLNMMKIYLQNLKGNLCRWCGVSYKDKRNLTGHLLKVHGVGKPRTCICGRSFVWESALCVHRSSCPDVIAKQSNSREISWKVDRGVEDAEPSAASE